MISILSQERLLGASLGIIFTGVIIFEQRRDIYNTIALNQPPNSQIKETYREKKSQFEISHYWNKAVDQAFKPAIQVLGYRKW
uniref:uncharacterized protein LOC122581786 n=1 Tax=Erigeron canadensis TaxID=72917 RepID=UPI001CB98CFF|nr:uncharacterized protein LOC122581786 [Erigeron canadensis]